MNGRAPIGRRHLLRISAAALALPAGVLALREIAGPGLPEAVRWQGEALGAQAGMTLWHPSRAVAQRTIIRMQGEVERLERIFSLYRPDSEIMRLNTEGRLLAPSREFLGVLQAARDIHEASAGAFDPTVQGLWQAHARHFAAAGAAGNRPALHEAIAAARDTGRFDQVDFSARGIGFARPGLAITLNGIAQGYITDRVTELLRNEGFDSAMIELGETRALGAAPDGTPFEVRLVNPLRPAMADRSLHLADAALAVSGGYGLRFGPPGVHHIFDPATGQSANRLLDVAVTASSAIRADALSTAIFVAGEADAPGILRHYPDARVTLTRIDGTRTTL